MSIGLLANSLRLADQRPAHARIVATLRLWALMGRMGWCQQRALVDQLGSPRVAALFQLLMEQIGAAWPDPFCVSPPCMPQLSHDETTLMAMLATASDRPRFDELLSDMLPDDARERLFRTTALLTDALQF
jgi:hypothetical protein